MTRFAALAILTLSVTGASAQEFSGACTSYKGSGKDACLATQWCRWVDRKPITLPDGNQFTPAGYCAFKPGHKEAWSQAQAKKPQ